MPALIIYLLRFDRRMHCPLPFGNGIKGQLPPSEHTMGIYCVWRITELLGTKNTDKYNNKEES